MGKMIRVALGHGPGLRERDQTLGLFIPKVQPRVDQAFADGHSVSVKQRFVIVDHFGQPVEWDAAVEVGSYKGGVFARNLVLIA